MTLAAILLALLTGGGLLLYLLDRLHYWKPDGPDTAGSQEDLSDPADTDGSECCGMHITCEKDSLVAGMDRDILYYDDEELDAFKGRPAGGYTADEIEMFREVLLTLRPDEIAGWARSVTTRGITLPGEVREELLMIVAEARDKR